MEIEKTEINSLSAFRFALMFSTLCFLFFNLESASESAWTFRAGTVFYPV